MNTTKGVKQIQLQTMNQKTMDENYSAGSVWKDEHSLNSTFRRYAYSSLDPLESVLALSEE